MKSKTLTFSWHHTVFTGGGIVFIKSGARPQDQSCAKHHSWSPGNVRKLQSTAQMLPCKRSVLLIKLLNTDARAPCCTPTLYLISGCPWGPSCPWVPKHPGGIGWNRIPLCLLHLCWAEVYNLHEMGPSRPEDAFEGAAECWSVEHIYCASCRARATHYLLADTVL